MVIAVMTEMLQLSWTWFGVWLSVEPKFEEFSLFCNLLLYEQAFGQLLNFYILLLAM